MANYLIVGATSGIGQALVQQLMKDGHSVFAIGRRMAEDVTMAYTADVTKDPLPAIAETLDGIVYCPGSITLKPFRALKPDELMNDMHINALGAVRVLQQYHANLQKAEAPSVVLFSTVAVGTGMPFHASVAMAKGAVEGLTRSLAAEWAPKIRVNCIAPSLTDTPLAAKLTDTEAKLGVAVNRHPLKRIGAPAEIAAAARFLLGADAAFVTGQVWHMDGGMSVVKA
jgi:3-oxoacyl-[acyl-carrier protein] reductase